VFSPYLTVFTGLNNHGKSAIFRAIKKLVRNAPLSDTFVSDWAKICIITLTCDNGQIIRKVRSVAASDSNIYKVNEDEYASFGITVPPQVLSVLEISPVRVFGVDTQLDFAFQGQLDTMFLVQGTGLAALRGKVLSAVTGVDLAQKAIQLCAADERVLASKIKVCREDRILLSADIAAYDDVDVLQHNAAVITEQVEHIKELSEFLVKLTDYKLLVEACVKKAQKLVTAIADLSADYTGELTKLQNKLSLLLLQKKAFDVVVRRNELKVLMGCFITYSVNYLEKKIDILRILSKANSIKDRISKLRRVTAISIPETAGLIETCTTVKKVADYLQLSRKKTILTEKVKVCNNAKDLLETTVNMQNVLDIVKRVKLSHASRALAFSKHAEATHEFSETSTAIVELEAKLGICPLCGKAF
jgi:hypothetical protein